MKKKYSVERFPILLLWICTRRKQQKRERALHTSKLEIRVLGIGSVTLWDDVRIYSFSAPFISSPTSNSSRIFHTRPMDCVKNQNLESSILLLSEIELSLETEWKLWRKFDRRARSVLVVGRPTQQFLRANAGTTEGRRGGGNQTTWNRDIEIVLEHLCSRQSRPSRTRAKRRKLSPFFFPINHSQCPKDRIESSNTEFEAPRLRNTSSFSPLLSISNTFCCFFGGGGYFDLLLSIAHKLIQWILKELCLQRNDWSIFLHLQAVYICPVRSNLNSFLHSPKIKPIDSRGTLPPKKWFIYLSQSSLAN